MKKNAFLIFLFFTCFFIRPLELQAQVLPFGGKIINVEYCTCSGNFLINYIKTLPNMPNLSFRPGASTLYQYQNLSPGMEILGITIAPDPCIIWVAVACVPHPMMVTGTSFLIKKIGTSDPAHLAGSGSSDNTGNPGGSDPTPPPAEDPDVDPTPLPSGQSCPAINGSDLMAQRYIIANEGWENTSYADPSGEGTNIGVGHQITGNEPFPVNGQITDDQVGQLFRSDYNLHRGEVEQLARREGVDWDSLSPQRQTVLTDMAFSMGSGRLAGFNNMWDALADGDYDRAGQEISDSDYGRAAASRGRAARNAGVMRSDRPNMINGKINMSQDALNYCSTTVVA